MLNVTLFVGVFALIRNVRTRPGEVLIRGTAVALEKVLAFRGRICQACRNHYSPLCVRFLDISF